MSTRYWFFSTGVRPVKKIVEFTPLAVKNVYNISFGDLLENGDVDDIVISNNGDIGKVLSTVIHIIKDFTAIHTDVKIFFIGSTKERTALYQRILKTYYSGFEQDFMITGIKVSFGIPLEFKFDPHHKSNYSAFFIKRKS